MRITMLLVLFSLFAPNAYPSEKPLETALGFFEASQTFRLEGRLKEYSRDGGTAYDLLYSGGVLKLSMRDGNEFHQLLHQLSNSLKSQDYSFDEYSENASFEGGMISAGWHMQADSLYAAAELEDPVLDGLAGDWSVVLTDGSQLAPWFLLVAGVGGEIDLKACLSRPGWKKSAGKQGVFRLAINPTTTYEIQVGSDSRVSKFVETKVRVSEQVRSKSTEYQASWEGSQLRSLGLKTSVKYTDGHVSGRESRFLVDVCEFGNGERLAIEAKIPNGTPVVLEGSPQIQAELRDGEVVRIYPDGSIKALGSLRMAHSRQWVIPAIVIFAFLTIGGVAWAVLRKRN